MNDRAFEENLKNAIEKFSHEENSTPDGKDALEQIAELRTELMAVYMIVAMAVVRQPDREKITRNIEAIVEYCEGQWEFDATRLKLYLVSMLKQMSWYSASD